MKNKRARPHLKPHHWSKGTSGNPRGNPRGHASLVHALKRVGVKKPRASWIMAEIAAERGYDEEECRNVDLVASLIFDAVAAMLYRAAGGDMNAAEKVAYLLEVVLYATEPKKPSDDQADFRISVNTQAVEALSGVSAMLGFKAPIAIEAGEAVPALPAGRPQNGKPAKPK